jgi:DNA polymerase III delta prime subunit
MAWLGLEVTEALPEPREGDVFTRYGLRNPVPDALPTMTAAKPHQPALERLARYDAMTPAVASISIGWLWASGTITVDGEPQPIVRPLATTTATLTPERSGVRITRDARWNLWPLAADDAAALEDSVPFGGGGLGEDPTGPWLRRFPVLTKWTNDVLAASDLPPVQQLTPPRDPRHIPTDRLEVIVGWGCFTEGTDDLLRPRETLSAWSADPAIGATAFASLYLGPRTPPGGSARPDAPPPPPEPLRVALPLTAAQEQAVRRARHEPITVVSGPPGTGKSQTAVAIASDAIARGERVLVATQSPMAADVLAELLDRVPGPTPVLFGGSTRASQLAAKLADGLDAPERSGDDERAHQLERDLQDLTLAVQTDLGDVAALGRWSHVALTAEIHRQRTPRLFDPDLAVAAERIEQAHRLLARHADPGWWSGLRRNATLDDLRELAGAPDDFPLDDLQAAVAAADLRLRAQRADDRDLHVADARWLALVAAEEAARLAQGTRTAAAISERIDADARRHVAALAAALRTGRARRRAHLSRVDVRALTTALPLWIGTLGEIESLLPATAAAFDLVILDEASMIDQPAASAALLRAERAVIIGDPRQLRFVSFLADAAIAAAIAEHRCDAFADKLDLRRTSAFDLAAAASPVTFLDEHFRSVPHLIGFSADHFYGGRLQIATRHPTNDDLAAIEVVSVAGERTGATNQAEIDEAVARARTLLDTTDASVGIISPHRPQVDALRTAVADAVGPDVWASGRLRVATVHGFQGSECDIVIASFGISDASGRQRRFLEDPNLFNVLITRARKQMIVLTSVDEVPDGLLADYLRWASSPPTPTTDLGTDDQWTNRLASLTADQGVPVQVGYPVGTWVVDLVVGDGPRAIAVTTRVHPDGPHRHVQRHLSLHRAGWHQAEAFPTLEAGDAARLALDLAAGP